MLSKYSVNKPYTVVVAVVLIVILGFVAYTGMTTDLLPSINLPYAVVVTTYGGATPEEVETVVTKPVEQTLATTTNLKTISSVSMENMSMVILEFYQDTNMDSITLEMRENLDLITSYWEDDQIGSPMIIKLNPDMIPLMVATIDIEGYSAAEISTALDERLLSNLESIEGVASVTTIGMVKEEVDVTISKAKLDALNDEINRAVDGDINKARAAINSAKAQLNAAASQLQSEMASQKQSLTEAESQLTAGKAELQKANEELTSTISDLSAQESLLKAALSGIASTRQQLETQKAQLEALGDERTPEQEAQLTLINQSLAALAEQEAESQANLTAIQEGLTQAKAGKAELDRQVAALAEQEGQLNDAKALLESEGAKAQAQIDEGLAQVNSQSEQLESSASGAKDEASIYNIITAEMINGILAAQNFSMPAGSIAGDSDDNTVKVGEKIKSIDELKNLFLFNLEVGDIGDITLQQVADIELTDNSDAIYAKINGNDGVLLSFQKQSSYSTTEVCDNIQTTIERLEGEYEGLTILPLMDQGEYINIVTNSVVNNLLMGAVLAILILFVFLRNIRPTLVIAVSIPTSVLFAIVLMYFSGVTLNIISLAGLALGVGMLVDNSIVVIENIYRLRSLGYSAKEAAIDGAKQVAGAITASTLTTISVFVPILFTNGLARQLFLDMGLTIAYSLVASLLVALSLVPAMGSGVLRNMKYKEGRLMRKMKTGYATGLGWALRHRALCLIAAVLLFIASIATALASGISFIPTSDSLELSATVTMKDENATKQELWDVCDEVTTRIMEIEDIRAVGAIQAGEESFMSMGSENSMSYYILLNKDKKLTSEEVAREIQQRTTDLPCTVEASSSGMDLSVFGGAGVTVAVKGEEINTLQEIAIDVQQAMGNLEGVTEVTDIEGDTVPEILVAVDKTKAMKQELTVAQVYAAVAAAAQDSSTATNLSIDGADYPVIVVDGTQETLTPDNIRDIVVVKGTGDEKDITVGDIATIKEQKSADTIRRTDQQRNVSVTATVDSAFNVNQLAEEVQAFLDAYEMPTGYSAEIQGESVTTADTMTDLLMAIALAVVLIYLIMVAQFQSLRSPLIILFTLPLAFTGGFLLLIICGLDVSIIAMLGILILSGIIVNNGIVLVDYINQLRKGGMSKREALIAGGATRMRPILMTAMTTIMGLVTLAMGLGMGAEMVQPMAVVTIGGLAYGTLMTLFIIPVIYDLFNRERKNHPTPRNATDLTAIAASEPLAKGGVDRDEQRK